MGYYLDKIEEEKKDMLDSAGMVSAIVVWLILMPALFLRIDTLALHFSTLFQRNVFLGIEKIMLENEIKYKFATDNGIKVKMEEK